MSLVNADGGVLAENSSQEHMAMTPLKNALKDISNISTSDTESHPKSGSLSKLKRPSRLSVFVRDTKTPNMEDDSHEETTASVSTTVSPMKRECELLSEEAPDMKRQKVNRKLMVEKENLTRSTGVKTKQISDKASVSLSDAAKGPLARSRIKSVSSSVSSNTASSNRSSNTGTRLTRTQMLQANLKSNKTGAEAAPPLSARGMSSSTVARTSRTTLAPEKPKIGKTAAEIKAQLEEHRQRESDMQDQLNQYAQKDSERQQQIDELSRQIAEVLRHQQEKEKEVQQVQSLRAEEREQLEASISSLRRERDELESEKRRLERDVMESNDRIRNLQKQLNDAQDEISKLKRSIDDLEDLMKKTKRDSEEELLHVKRTLTMEMQTTRMELEEKLSSTQYKLEASESLSGQRSEKIVMLERDLAQKIAMIEELEQKRQSDELLRRKLHNTIQELKGNIRVFCRVRPSLDGEMEMMEMNFRDDDEREEIEIAGPKVVSATGEEREGKKMKFAFDRVFQPHASQEEVFEEVEQLVQSSLDGYRVCIFAYGATGSGKTFTMENYDPQVSSSWDGEMPPSVGLIPRTVQKIFDSTEQLRDKGWEFTFEASFLEIYNETIRDLLAPTGSELKYELKHDSDGEVYVTNVIREKVDVPRQVYRLLERASAQRAWASTKCNTHSSRSHSVFRLYITGRNINSDQIQTGILNLVDLAGSENLKKTGNTGQRMEETKSINRSLSCLGDVIASLANHAKHIPYRNSTLTHLLSNSLSGDSKTLMFVNIAPTSAELPEAISSLRFATKVNNCEIGTARRRVEVRNSNASSSNSSS